MSVSACVCRRILGYGYIEQGKRISRECRATLFDNNSYIYFIIKYHYADRQLDSVLIICYKFSDNINCRKLPFLWDGNWSCFNVLSSEVPMISTESKEEQE